MANIKELSQLGKEATILYVEDEEKLRASVSKYFEKIFKHADIACNGQEGLDTYLKNNYDIVITDISMPKMDGIEMAKQIKLNNPNQNIVILSAYAESSMLLDAIRLGADGYVLKPIDFEHLNEVLYKILYKIKEFRENYQYKLHLQELVDEKTKEACALEEVRIQNYKNTLYALVDLIEQRDTYTGGHSNRVATYSKLIAKQMGFSQKECNEIYEAGILHDIGKVAIPDSILLKPGKLNDLEYKLIQEHVMIGYKILKKVPMFSNIAEIVKVHHERYNGSGYPEGLRGDAIHPLSMIMAVADAFDAMTTRRIYKMKKSQDEALKEIADLSEIWFSSEVAAAAQIALRDVVIDVNINQLPLSGLEKERFSYFYKDQLTKSYNSNYLDLILIQNSHDGEYDKIHFLFLNGFGKYNEVFGWEQGNKILKEISWMLKNLYKEDLVFRIHGDDFAIISNTKCDMSDIVDFLKSTCIKVSTQTIDIKEKQIYSLQFLEMLLNH